MPYLIFNGNAGEAIRWYQSILGGELTLQTYGESNMGSSEEEKKRVIHASLKNDALSFMVSDAPPVKEFEPHVGDNIHMSILGSDEQLLTGFFTKLAAGGTINMPLEKQFWGDTYGILTDKFGIRWSVNISAQAAA